MAEEEQKAPEKQIAIQKIYLKDFSFESPRSPQVFQSQDFRVVGLVGQLTHAVDADAGHASQSADGRAVHGGPP